MLSRARTLYRAAAGFSSGIDYNGMDRQVMGGQVMDSSRSGMGLRNPMGMAMDYFICIGI